MMTKTDNIIQEFLMLDSCLQRCQLNNDADGVQDTLHAMKHIVMQAKLLHAEIFEQRPDLKEIFKTLEELCF